MTPSFFVAFFESHIAGDEASCARLNHESRSQALSVAESIYEIMASYFSQPPPRLSSSSLDRVVSALLCLLILCISIPRCYGHSTSHVDVWVRCGDRLDARVTLFLDNVMEMGGLERGRSGSLLSEVEAKEAFQRFESALPGLLQIYDSQGQLLTVGRVDGPRWQVSPRGVDLRAESGLRLTWKLEFPWNPDARSFSIEHEFVQHQSDDTPTSTEPILVPAELRLRVRTTKSPQRLTATISHHHPHTIAMPSDTDTRDVVKSDTATAQAAATFILLPGQLVHEFTIPVALARLPGGLLSGVPPLADNSDSSVATSSALSSMACRKQALQQVQEGLRIKADDELLVPVRLTARMLAADNEQLDNDRPIPIVGTRLGIRATYGLHAAPQRLLAVWDSMPAEVQQIEVHTNLLSGASSQIVTRQGVRLEYEYTHPTDEQNGPSRSADQFNDNQTLAVSSDAFWQPANDWKWGWTLLWSTFAACAAMLAVRFLRYRRTELAAATVAAIALAVTNLLSPGPGSEPRSDASNIVQEFLRETYSLALTEQDDQRVTQLSQILTDEMVESINGQIVSVRHADSDDGPLIEVEQVVLTHCESQDFESDRMARFSCEWQVDGRILHWGHRHHRRLLLTGVIQLETSSDRCLLSDITLNTARYDRVSGD